MSDKMTLSTNRVDVAAAAVRGAVGAVPFVGNLLAEIVTSFIPNQKLDRVARFAEILAAEVGSVKEASARLEERLKSAEGSDLLEEGLVQASRAVSDDRRHRIAAILASGLTDDVLRYDRTRKLLSILDSLNDSEILLLLFYSRSPAMGSAWHNDLIDRHPELLRPASREIGGPDSERERGAMRDSYERTLLANGLLDSAETRLRLSALGQMLLKYSATREDSESASPAA
jgi:hypothetical protein